MTVKGIVLEDEGGQEYLVSLMELGPAYRMTVLERRAERWVLSALPTHQKLAMVVIGLLRAGEAVRAMPTDAMLVVEHQAESPAWH